MLYVVFTLIAIAIGYWSWRSFKKNHRLPFMKIPFALILLAFSSYGVYHDYYDISIIDDKTLLEIPKNYDLLGKRYNSNFPNSGLNIYLIIPSEERQSFVEQIIEKYGIKPRVHSWTYTSPLDSADLVGKDYWVELDYGLYYSKEMESERIIFSCHYFHSGEFWFSITDY